jgi:hypothetical protein
MGLLMQFLNPNPEIFPVRHPYRRGDSSCEIKGVGDGASASKGDRDRDRGFRQLQPLMDVKSTKTDKSSSSSAHSRAALSPSARPLSMQRTCIVSSSSNWKYEFGISNMIV